MSKRSRVHAGGRQAKSESPSESCLPAVQPVTRNFLLSLVGRAGFEPATLCLKGPRDEHGKVTYRRVMWAGFGCRVDFQRRHKGVAYGGKLYTPLYIIAVQSLDCVCGADERPFIKAVPFIQLCASGKIRSAASFSPRRCAGLRAGAVPRAPFPPSPEKLTKISHKPARPSGGCGSFPYGGQPTAAADPTIWPRTVERIAWKNGIRAGATPLLHTPRDNRNTAPRPLRGVAPCTGGLMEYRHA